MNFENFHWRKILPTMNFEKMQSRQNFWPSKFLRNSKKSPNLTFFYVALRHEDF